jgi:hypothetical protein
MYDNTVGSRSTSDIAYIAGFLDGDGSIMLQIKKRKDTQRGFRFMATLCLYQDTRHEKTLHWIRSKLRIGYVSQRNDGMSELRINGFASVRNILTFLLPYVRFKKVQAKTMLRACDILVSKKFSLLTDTQIRKLVDLVLELQNENYATHKKRTRSELLKQVGLTP